MFRSSFGFENGDVKKTSTVVRPPYRNLFVESVNAKSNFKNLRVSETLTCPDAAPQHNVDFPCEQTPIRTNRYSQTSIPSGPSQQNVLPVPKPRPLTLPNSPDWPAKWQSALVSIPGTARFACHDLRKNLSFMANRLPYLSWWPLLFCLSRP